MSTTCEIFFPTHELVDQPWAVRALHDARYNYMDAHNMEPLGGAVKCSNERKTEQWRYEVAIKETP